MKNAHHWLLWAYGYLVQIMIIIFSFFGTITNAKTTISAKKDTNMSG